MLSIRSQDCLYTALFCEENVWWLGRRLLDQGMDPASIHAVMFGNPADSVAMFNQRAAHPGGVLSWDYHVVLRVRYEARLWIFDLDSLLSFPCPCEHYLASSFPPQDSLPPRLRVWMRLIEIQHYCTRLSSDRSHMLGRIPSQAFPNYPAILPDEDRDPVGLSDYRDLNRQISGSQVWTEIGALCTATVSAAQAGRR